ncbi:MAG: hypothetical protein WBM08_14905, partial [Prochlorococcaceae cyanobacterium]
MSFFDQFRPARNNDESNERQPANTDVQLSVNGGSPVTIPADEVNGQTIAELFATYAEDLGTDPGRISRYVDNGAIVTPETVPVPGHAYMGTANSDSKG